VPRTAITPQVPNPAAQVTYEAANVLGNSFGPRPGRGVHIKNGSGGSITVTLPTPGTINGLAIADRTVAITAGTDQFIGIGVGNEYIQSDGSAYIDYSAVTSVTVAVIDL
jgi:hypothetical protein